MSTFSHSDITSKWAPDIDSVLGTQSNPSKTASFSPCTSSQSSYPSIFPLSMKISAQTIGHNLVSIKPMSGPSMGLFYTDYEYNPYSIYNSILQKIERMQNLNCLYTLLKIENLIKIEFTKDCNIDFYEIKYIEKIEKDVTNIYTISFNKFISEKYQDICEYSIIEVIEMDWKSFSRDKKIDGILD